MAYIGAGFKGATIGQFADGDTRNLKIRGTAKYHEILTFPKAKIVGSEVI